MRMNKELVKIEIGNILIKLVRRFVIRELEKLKIILVGVKRE